MDYGLSLIEKAKSIPFPLQVVAVHNIVFVYSILDHEIQINLPPSVDVHLDRVVNEETGSDIRGMERISFCL